MSVAYWQESGAGHAPERADVAIVGAGMVGAYLALRLQEAGRRVALVEARQPAGGASGRNAGMVLSGVADNYCRAIEQYGRADARGLWSLTLQNRELVRQLALRLGIEFQQCGSLILAMDQQEAQELAASAALLADDGFEASFSARDPLGRGFAGALYNPGDGVLHPVALVAGLAAASGAQICAGHEVYALESLAQGVLVRARGLELLAQQVILATNAYTPLLEPLFAETILPQRGQMLLTGPAPSLLAPACYANHGYIYFRQLPDGRFLLGGCRNLAFEQESTFAEGVTPRLQQALEQFLHQHFPDIRAPIERRWSGTMGFTPDGLPLVGLLRRDPRIGLVAGFNGHGFGFGFVAADALLARMRGAQPGLFDARRLLPDVCE